jgi:Telomeric single stranded DNA binding POT1/CDC13
MISQSLDPIMLQQAPSQPIANDFGAQDTTSLLGSVLSAFPANQSGGASEFLSRLTQMRPTLVADGIQPEGPPPSEMLHNPEESTSAGVEAVDRAAEEEFLTGLLPMGDQDVPRETAIDHKRTQSQEFLPHIVPDISPQPQTNEEQVLPELGEKRLRTEPELSPKPDDLKDVTIQVEEMIEVIMQEPKTQQPAVSPGRPLKTELQPPETLATIVIEQSIRVEPPPRSPTPPPLPDEWRIEGLTTPLGYYPPLADIVPPGLRAQKENRTVDLIGIIRESSEIGKTKGPDYVLPLHIVDPSTGPSTGLSVLLFRPYKSALPTNPQKGSAIVLTDMKVIRIEMRLILDTIVSASWTG